MDGQYRFGMAAAEDVDEIIRLYRSIIGTSGCTWSEEYPAIENVLSDIGKDSLYCLRDDRNRIVAVAAAGEDDELEHDGLRWDERMKRPCDLARIGVAPELQGRGLGARIMKELMKDVRRRGFDGIRMLVSMSNPAALALYDRMGFSRCGEIYKYDIDFFCYQIILI